MKKNSIVLLFLSLLTIATSCNQRKSSFEKQITKDSVFWNFKVIEKDNYVLLRQHTFHKDKTYKWYIPSENGSKLGKLNAPIFIDNEDDFKKSVNWNFNENDSIFYLGTPELVYKISKLSKDTIFLEDKKRAKYIMVANVYVPN